MHIKATRYSGRMVIIKKQKTASVGEVAEKRKLCILLMGIVWVFLLEKFEIELPDVPAIPLLGIYL